MTSSNRWRTSLCIAAADARLMRVEIGLGRLDRGSVGDASGTQPMSWLESAMLHYQGQRWHIQFLHSTRAASTSN
jgi:hypothetical protein